ncbi:unnamed protein product [Notodromas monacha]|uniref:Uncharacterized protein n=1 Tax=Notodromas monacha TaxID=399045 RepID=A0A7R9BXY5_9CRUS|nr:unnamed protein product [Notodromas monacha]CAG0922305.1 unnamed protein product [Notodromas monacha]
MSALNSSSLSAKERKKLFTRELRELVEKRRKETDGVDLLALASDYPQDDSDEFSLHYESDVEETVDCPVRLKFDAEKCRTIAKKVKKLRGSNLVVTESEKPVASGRNSADLKHKKVKKRPMDDDNQRTEGTKFKRDASPSTPPILEIREASLNEPELEMKEIASVRFPRSDEDFRAKYRLLAPESLRLKDVLEQGPKFFSQGDKFKSSRKAPNLFICVAEKKKVNGVYADFERVTWNPKYCYRNSDFKPSDSKSKINPELLRKQSKAMAEKEALLARKKKKEELLKRPMLGFSGKVSKVPKASSLPGTSKLYKQKPVDMSIRIPKVDPLKEPVTQAPTGKGSFFGSSTYDPFSTQPLASGYVVVPFGLRPAKSKSTENETDSKTGSNKDSAVEASVPSLEIRHNSTPPQTPAATFDKKERREPKTKNSENIDGAEETNKKTNPENVDAPKETKKRNTEKIDAVRDKRSKDSFAQEEPANNPQDSRDPYAADNLLMHLSQLKRSGNVQALEDLRQYLLGELSKTSDEKVVDSLRILLSQLSTDASVDLLSPPQEDPMEEDGPGDDYACHAESSPMDDHPACSSVLSNHDSPPSETAPSEKLICLAPGSNPLAPEGIETDLVRTLRLRAAAAWSEEEEEEDKEEETQINSEKVSEDPVNTEASADQPVAASLSSVSSMLSMSPDAPSDNVDDDVPYDPAEAVVPRFDPVPNSSNKPEPTQTPAKVTPSEDPSADLEDRFRSIISKNELVKQKFARVQAFKAILPELRDEADSKANGAEENSVNRESSFGKAANVPLGCETSSIRSPEISTNVNEEEPQAATSCHVDPLPPPPVPSMGLLRFFAADMDSNTLSLSEFFGRSIED